MTAVLDGYRVTSPARQVFGAAVGLPARGHASAIVVINRASGTTPLLAEANRLKLDTTVVRDSFPGDVRVVRRLRRAVIRTRAQVLETHGYKPNILAALLKPTLGVPWIAFLHGETRENAKVRLYFALERLAVRLADRVVVVSEDMARVAAGFGVRKDRLRVIHNVYVPPSPLGDAAASTEFPGKDPVIGVVARLSPEKGVDVAVRVHQIVVRDKPNARLLVLGEGPERGSLAALTAQLGLADHITWAGYQDDPDRFYRGMDVVLIPSRSEGLPQAALEAMAHGLPVVATRVGGIPEAIEDGLNGFLAPAGDVETLAARVSQLLDDSSLRRRLGERGRQVVESNFSLKAKVVALTDMYQELAA